MVSVVLTTYNRPKLLIRALESVKVQTFQPKEIILVDDSSDKNATDFIKKRLSEDIIYLRHKRNLGLAAARNTGLRHSKGDFIAYLDDDDIWMPTHLKRICSVIDKLPPDPDFEVSQQSEPGESGLSQGLESHHLSDQSSHNAASLEEADSQSSRVGSRDVTPDTSLSQRIDGKAFKKPKKRCRPVELHQ